MTRTQSILLLALAAVAGLATAPALASRQLLDAEGLRSTVVGKRVYLATPLGGEFPLYYRRDGRVDGSGEAIGLGRWVRPTDSGRWWIAGDQLCQKWQTWYDGKPFCFTVRDLGNGKIEWVRDDGMRGVARLGR